MCVEGTRASAHTTAKQPDDVTAAQPSRKARSLPPGTTRLALSAFGLLFVAPPLPCRPNACCKKVRLQLRFEFNELGETCSYIWPEEPPKRPLKARFRS